MGGSMALEEYRRKRDFRQDAGAGGSARRRNGRRTRGLSFVIQKHAARRLHYDFRLELDGVLKSWAVPKGPSLDPGEKRLAVHVEDHPLDYGGFEGVIPEGEYGGGTVLLWDRGTWAPLNSDPEAAYRKGSLKFTLHGEKLHGNWALVRMGGKAASERHENWLLIKERDEEAVPQQRRRRRRRQPAQRRDRPVDGRDRRRPRPGLAFEPATASETAAGCRPSRCRSHPPAPAKRRDARKNRSRSSRRWSRPGARGAGMAARDQIRRLPAARPHRGRRGPADHPQRSRLDRQISGAGADASASCRSTAALIDGELVHLEPDGTTSFAGLQDAISSGKTDALMFFAFDLLYRDGWDLTGAALEDRKAALAEIVPPQAQGMLRYSDHQIGRGPAFFAPGLQLRARRHRLEAPDRALPAGAEPQLAQDQMPQSRGVRRRRLHRSRRQPRGFRRAAASAITTREGKLRYAGRVGTGFNTAQLIELHRRLESLAQPDPTVTLPKGVSRKGVHWIEPRLVAEVEFADWTADAILRQASFQGLREDKDAERGGLRPEITRAAVGGS